MKLKMTIIAFFASVLVLTSCMKNEVSPGIEQIRTAYANLLNAKAQAETTIANAEANYRNAVAEYQQALAAVQNANAAYTDAETAQLLEDLAEDMALNALLIEEAQAQQLVDLEELRIELQELGDAEVLAYYAKYKTALHDYQQTQNNILAKMEQIAQLELDLLQDTTRALDKANADLAAAQAELAALQEELVLAQASLGDTEAMAARVLELKNDSIALNALILDKKAQLEEMKHDADAEMEALTAEGFTTTKPVQSACPTTWADSLAGALADFSDFSGHWPIEDSGAAYPWPAPEFWLLALANVDTAQSELDNAYADTATSYNLWNDAVELIATGTDDLDAEIADSIQAIIDYTDTIAGYFADSVTAYAAYQFDSAAIADLRQDTADWNAEILVLADSAADQRARAIAAADDAPGNADSTLLAQTVADSTLLEAQVTVAELTTIPALVQDSTDAWDLWDDAGTILGSKRTTFEGLIASAEGALGTTADMTSATLYGELYLLEEEIAEAEANLDDYYSNYLYNQTFLTEFEEALAAALQAKEDLREDFETYMDEFYDKYIAGLQSKADSEADDCIQAGIDFAELLAEWKILDDAYDLARKPYNDLDDEIENLETDLGILNTIIAAYNAANDYNIGIVEALETLIANAEDAVENALEAVEAIEKAYAEGEVDIDQFNAELDELNDLLAANLEQVNFWKALLDEAIANASN